MVDFHRLKNLGTDILGRAGELAEQAKDKVVPLAEQAKDKVGPLAEQAKDKVSPLAERAKDAAARGVDKATEGLDSATGRKFHDKLGDVTGNREKNPSAPSEAATGMDATSVADEITEDPAPSTHTDHAPDPAPSISSRDTPVRPADAAVDEPTSAVDAVSADPRDADSAKAARPELLIVTDDGELHNPTPADMPRHRPTDESS